MNRMAENPYTSAQAPASSANANMMMQMLAPNVALQQIQLQRAQQMADLLRQRGLADPEQTQVISGWAVPNSPINGIGRVAEALIGKYLQNKNDEKQANIGQAYAEALRSGLDKYNNEHYGTPPSAPIQAQMPQQPPQLQAGGMQNGIPVSNADTTSAPLGQPMPPAPVVPQIADQSMAQQPPQAQIPQMQGQQTQAQQIQPHPMSQSLPRPQVGWNNPMTMDDVMQGMRYAAFNPEAAKTFYNNIQLTDAQKNDRAYMTPDQARAAYLGQKIKEGTQTFEPNKTYQLPNGQVVVGTDYANGQANGVDANGNPTIAAIPGFNKIAADKAAAIASANEGAKPITIDTPQGKITMTTAELLARSGQQSGRSQQPIQSNPNNGNVLNPQGIQLPSKLVDNLIMTESSGNPNAVNPSTKATGLGQFIPSTTKALNDAGYKFDPRNPEQSRAAINDYLVNIIKKNGGDPSNPADVAAGLKAYGGFKTADPSQYIGKIMNGVSFNGSNAQNQSNQGGITQLTDAEKARQSEIAKGEGAMQTKFEEGLNNKVAQSQALMQRYAYTDNALKNYTTGGGKENRIKLAQSFQAIGLPKDFVDKVAGGSLGSGQIIQSLAAQEAIQQMQAAVASDTGGAARTNKAMYDNFVQANPNLDKDPEAFKKVMDLSKELHNKVLEEQNMFNAYKNAHNGNASGFQNFYANYNNANGGAPSYVENPVFSKNQQPAPPQSSSQQSPVGYNANGAKHFVGQMNADLWSKMKSGDTFTDAQGNVRRKP